MPERQRTISNEESKTMKLGVLNSHYRPEIDSLRAIAVIAVIANHIAKERLPCGYLGVDIFFVISGYVITASLTRRREESFHRFITQFYARRFKRILPALVAFVVFSSLAVCIVSADPNVFIQTGVRALLGTSNLFLVEQATDYFAPNAELNPFTHTWSLAVEEQFYLLFPLLLWSSGFLSDQQAGRQRLNRWISALSCASLLGFITLYSSHQPAAYYLMPTRFWELATGCVICVDIELRRWARTSHEITPWLLLAALIGVMLWPQERGMPATVVVVGLTAGLIISLKPGIQAHRWLTIRPLRFIGLISYSLYLWHWGVLALSRLTIGIHWWTLPVQVPLMVILAMGSYQWIETPWRRQSGFNSDAPVLAWGAGAMIGSALILQTLNQASSYFYAGDLASARQQTRQEIHGRSCRAREHFPACIAQPMNPSIKQPRRRQRLLIVGDSHALHHVGLAERLADTLDIEAAIYAQHGYPFPPNPLIRKSAPDEAKRGLAIQQKAEAQIDLYLHSGDLLLIVNSGSYYSDRQRKGKREERSPFLFPNEHWQGNNQTDFLRRLGKSLEELTTRLGAKGIRVIYFLPTPLFKETDYARCNPEWFQKQNQDSACQESISLRAVNRRYKDTLYRTLSSAKRPIHTTDQLLIFDPKAALCTAEACDRIIQGHQAYLDGSHLSRHGSELVADALAEFLIRSDVLHQAVN